MGCKLDRSFPELAYRFIGLLAKEHRRYRWANPRSPLGRRQPDEPIGKTVSGTFFWRVGRVRHAGGMLNQSLGIAKARRTRHPCQRIHEGLAGDKPT
jgi:hypothetical protein